MKYGYSIGTPLISELVRSNNGPDWKEEAVDTRVPPSNQILVCQGDSGVRRSIFG